MNCTPCLRPFHAFVCLTAFSSEPPLGQPSLDVITSSLFTTTTCPSGKPFPAHYAGLVHKLSFPLPLHSDSPSLQYFPTAWYSSIRPVEKTPLGHGHPLVDLLANELFSFLGPQSLSIQLPHM